MNRVTRLARSSDAADIAAIYAPIVRDTTISFEAVPPTANEMEARIEAVLADLPWIVGTEGGRIVGYAYATRFRSRAAYRWTVEVSVYVHPGHQGRGVGRGLYTVLFELLRVQGFRVAIAVIALPNERSVALHEHLGFVRAGVMRGVGAKFGAWIDTGYWQRDLSPHVRLDRAPLTPAEAAALPEWKSAFELQPRP